MKTILIIEDNQEIRDNTSEILELYGYNVIPAENGKEGIEKATKQAPDLILCDIMMPEVDGYTVIRELKSNPTTSSIPFIYLTASGERNEVEMAMNMGACGYLRKPFEPRELTELVNKQMLRSV